MTFKTFTFKSNDGEEIFTYEWFPKNTELKGIVHITHGLSEHAGRYANFAAELNSSGYAVYAHDQRGHGKTAKNADNLVHIGEGGWNSMQKDLLLLIDIIKSSHSDLPLFLFGHSMGSFILRNILQNNPPKVKGVILSGTGYYERLALNAGILLAKSIVKRKGGQKRSYYINKITFRAFNANIPNPKTFFDWISRDEKVVADFYNDPLCRINCSNNLFLELFKGLKTIEHPKNIEKISKNIPIFLVSGDNDPVGHWGKDVPELVNLYKSIGVKEVRYKLYPGARHEIINEINKAEVIKDIIDWMDSIA